MKIEPKLIKTSVLIFISIVIFIYFINLIISINNNYNVIKTTEKKNEELNKNILQEIKNQEKIEKSGKNFLTTAYFDKKEKFFENYIRALFNKYQIKINIYQSSINETENAELDVTFDANAFNFFKLLNDMEEGEKIIVVKNISISRSAVPQLKVNMKLAGYYKE